MHLSFVLTVPESKWLIAHGIAALPEIQQARSGGAILLKGGTTVSALAEVLVGQPLRISGRVTSTGLRSAARACSAPHWLLISDDDLRNVDDDLPSVVAALGPGDVVVTGANLIDCAGNAALMLGSDLGGSGGRVLAGLMAEGCEVIIAAGLEKFSPFPVADAIRSAGRKKGDLVEGMSVGLTPLAGRIFTEIDAIRTLYPSSQVTVIGRGGIQGAEGGTAFLVEAPEAVAVALWEFRQSLRGKPHSASPQSLVTCTTGGRNCAHHAGCSTARRLAARRASAAPPIEKE